MQHVVFARDRRKRKSRIKGLIFFVALLSIFIGIILALKNQSPVNVEKTEQFNVFYNGEEMPLQNVVEVVIEATDVSSAMASVPVQEPKIAENTAEDTASDVPAEDPNGIDDVVDAVESVDESATSYEDELAAQDDVDNLDGEATASADAEKEKQAAQEQLSPEAEEALANFLDAADQAIRIKEQFSYTVARGDKLRDVLEQSGVEPSIARTLIRKFPELANLSAGQQFYGVLDGKNDLEYLNWLVSEKQEQIFERKSNGQFVRSVVEKKGEWRQDVLKGTLSGDFSASLKDLGLSQRQINQLASGLQWQIATNKLKKGDKFAIAVKREYINGKPTELGNVDGIHIISGKKSYYAIQADDGRYYSRHGETLGKGFSRYPLQNPARVSSPFNPRRFHPVTRRIAPHKGVDFGLGIGTPIIAPADGVVEHVAYQANGAGRYIKLRHGREYTTVYMHLSKSLVRVGQSVKKGERIALSGNTGRSTGPHLHYEFHINGRPVNPMTVKLPGTGSGMPDKDRKEFLSKARAIESKLSL